MMKISTYKKIILFIIVLFFVAVFVPQTYAQMMMNYGNPSITPEPTKIQQQQQDEAAGKKLYDEFNNNQIACQKLTADNFEKIGEYATSQMFGGNTSAHVAMNERMQQMRGEQGEEQMHIQIGKNVTGCYSQNQNGGVPPMMGWGGYGYGNMMNGNFGLGFTTFHFLIALVVLVDLVLVGVWLWKQIKKK